MLENSNTNRYIMLDDIKNYINNYFHSRYIKTFPEGIHNQLLYLWDDGKRLRPALFITICPIYDLTQPDRLLDNMVNIISDYAVNIELLHCLSLLVDDLPEMDNEIVRRGRPCFHKVFGIQKSNMFIYYLLSRITNNLSTIFNNNNELEITYSRLRIIEHTAFISHYITSNLIDGQYLDMLETSISKKNTAYSEILDNNISIVLELIINMILELKIINLEAEFKTSIEKCIILIIKKTGTLFALPLITGLLTQLYITNSLYTGNEIPINDNINLETSFEQPRKLFNEIKPLRRQSEQSTNSFNLGADNLYNLIITWGFLLGFFYQMSDDYLDYKEDLEKGKPNICNLLGIDASITLLNFGIQTLKNITIYIKQNLLILWPNTIQIEINIINQILDIITNRIS